MKESLQLLNDWEHDANFGVITKDMFLTASTAERLRVSILSTLDLAQYLLTEVRQAAGESDHPDMPTFIQLYRMLAVFSMLKPPKFGNCEAREEAPVIDFAAFRAAFKNKKSDESSVDMLKAKLDGLSETEAWDCDDIVTTDYNSVEVVDAILYYAWAQSVRNTATAAAKELWRSLLEYLDDPKAPAIGTRLRLRRESENVISQDAH
ncbi:hypothetical protein HPB52_010528 [Rhipicephalus sanguineus]|uniref:Uncharacterized protein n=1 Tax=Rhipicephalus sanguineus TaxID=34632 RepID=A0A9D4SQ23_RHISA|nr:hypothetical protein HPB52_010528 [Rhipicephalus sanguineus]